MTEVVPVNDRGRRIGQAHHRARLTDLQVEAMRQLHEDKGFGYRRLSALFGVSKRHVRDVLAYKKRAQTVAGHRVRLTTP